jgi:lipopolysaccharide/colanic/teichoic acid biosynthesis glycosyltransferase
VLMGDMAIIGPRPLVAADLDAMPDKGEARSRSRPGITGWAQVNGGHQLTPEEKLALDLYYSEHASLRFDARIVWRTVMMMLFGERRDDKAIATALKSFAQAG